FRMRCLPERLHWSQHGSGDNRAPLPPAVATGPGTAGSPCRSPPAPHLPQFPCGGSRRTSPDKESHSLRFQIAGKGDQPFDHETVVRVCGPGITGYQVKTGKKRKRMAFSHPDRILESMVAGDPWCCLHPTEDV